MKTQIFRPVARHLINEIIPCVKYVSERSGLVVAVAETPGPMVNGYLCFATETDTNDGLPHTLEHLVFMGSKAYPWKGVLDVVANRSLGSGTNAATYEDHTYYDMSTVGQEGFLKVLPIYFDHVFRPLLTPSQYVTEVHHITGEGEDAGVVYSEMEDYESEMRSMVDWRMRELLYPEGSGYRVETGGRLAAIRDLCSNDRVRAFHERYYRLRNCIVIVCGKIDHDALFACLEEQENVLLKDIEQCSRHSLSTPFTRPFTSNDTPVLRQIPIERVLCPSDDDTKALVSMAWRGPLATDSDETTSLNILNEYLSVTAVAPLQRCFVQTDEPCCADVELEINDQYRCMMTMNLSGVLMERLEEVVPRLSKVMAELADGSMPIDVDRMHAILKQRILDAESAMENSAPSTVGDMLMGDFLYGDSEENTIARLNPISVYKRLYTRTQDEWRSLLAKYYAGDKPTVTVFGIPSQEPVVAFTAGEKARVDMRHQVLGEEGLAKCKCCVEDAVKENDAAHPSQSFLDDNLVTSLSNVAYVEIDTERQLNLPLPVSVAYARGSRFVKTRYLIDTSSIEPSLRKYLTLFSAYIFQSAMKDDKGTVTEFEQIVNELNRDLVDHSFGTGICGVYQRVATLDVVTSMADSALGVKWLYRLLHNVHFEESRLSIVVAQLLNSAAEERQEGNSMCRMLLTDAMYDKDSNARMGDTIVRQEFFLKEVQSALETNPSAVIGDLQRLYAELNKRDRAAVHVTCDVDAVGDRLSSEWRNHFGDTPTLESSVLPSSKESPDLGIQLGRHTLASIGACESSFCQIATPIGELTYGSERHAQIAVFLQMLSQTEGPLWKKIRGRGYAYGAYATLHFDSGVLEMDLYCSAMLVKAYAASKKIVESYLSGATPMDTNEMEAAKRSLVYDTLRKESTVSAASNQTLLHKFRHVTPQANRELCDRILAVNNDSVLPVARDLVGRLFEADASVTAITCHPSKVSSIVKGFAKMGIKLDKVSLETKSDLFI